MFFGGNFLKVAACAFISAASEAIQAFMRWPTGYCSICVVAAPTAEPSP